VKIEATVTEGCHLCGSMLVGIDRMGPEAVNTTLSFVITLLSSLKEQLQAELDAARTDTPAAREEGK
jgi:outer membrane murein-binding lipoprotein Lpp